MIVQQNFGTCYSTYASHILSGGLSQRPSLFDEFDFHIVGGAGGNRLDNFGSGSNGEVRRRKTRRNQKRSITGGSDCGGSLPLGDLNVNVAAQVRPTTKIRGLLYRSLES